MKQYDFLVLGAGIFGITTAIELRKKKYTVAILNPDTIFLPLLVVSRKQHAIFALVGSLLKAARHRWYEALPCAKPTNESNGLDFVLLVPTRITHAAYQQRREFHQNEALRFFALVGSLSKAARHCWYEALPCAKPTNESKIKNQQPN